MVKKLKTRYECSRCESLLNDASKQHGGCVELTVGVLGEKLVFLKQVPQHALVHLL